MRCKNLTLKGLCELILNYFNPNTALTHKQHHLPPFFKRLEALCDGIFSGRSGERMPFIQVDFVVFHVLKRLASRSAKYESDTNYYGRYEVFAASRT